MNRILAWLAGTGTRYWTFTDRHWWLPRWVRRAGNGEIIWCGTAAKIGPELRLDTIHGRIQVAPGTTLAHRRGRIWLPDLYDGELP